MLGIDSFTFKRVLTISGKSSTSLIWNDNFGGSRQDVDPNTNTAVSDEYEPVMLHQTTSLLLDKTRCPPVYQFSSSNAEIIQEPIASEDPNTAAVVNRTGEHVDIGSGYITGSDSDPNTEFHTALVWRSIPSDNFFCSDGNTVDVSYTPVLTVWADLPNVTESKLITQLPNVTPLWQGNLARTLGRDLDFIVTCPGKGRELVVNGPKIFPDLAIASAQGVSLETVDIHYPVVTYTAELAFTSPFLAYEGAKVIAKRLIGDYYPVKITYKMLTVGLALGGHCCNDAERDTLEAIELLSHTYGNVSISGHSGAALLFIEGGIEKWTEINPASRQWFNATAVNIIRTNTAFDGTNGDAFSKVNVTDENGKGPANLNGFTEAAAVQNSNGEAAAAVEAAAPAEQDRTKFRSVRRAGGGRRPALPLGA
ncbi:hypothetical protein C8Q79DRAFT_930109 [Trametes meyenii]|nr:hypothetical protein C8Q79DRAFT_930109 [Trametes meyenii]